MNVESATSILSAGGNLVINMMGHEFNLRMAQAAKRGNSHVTLVGRMDPKLLADVAAEAPGHVTFDVAEYPGGS